VRWQSSRFSFLEKSIVLEKAMSSHCTPYFEMSQTYQESVAELNRCHKSAAMIVGAFLGLSLALIGIAFLMGDALYRPGDVRVAYFIWGLIIILSFAALFIRRMRLDISRLYDISVLRGVNGMLRDMQSTTFIVATLGGAVALLGFIVMIRTGNEYDMLRAGVIAIGILLYSYPQKSAWLRVVQWLEKKNSTS
jgi:uncharacterized membrane protein YhaH (DUF805 family)